MIIARNWLEEWIDLSGISSDKICAKLNAIGLEVDSFTSVRMPENIVIGRVVSCKDHENSDHLHVCEVDIGSEILQIVCGAKNVALNQIVPLALIGAKMPNGMEIKHAKLRGVESFGMICSASELGLPKLNDGIMVLDESIGELNLGRKLSEIPAFNDDIIEIELTPNRGDCLSLRGIARDLGAAFELGIKKINYNEKENLIGIGRILSVKTDEKIGAKFIYKAIELKQNFSLNLLQKIRANLTQIVASNDLETILAYATHASGVLFRAYDFEKLPSENGKVALEIRPVKQREYGVFCGENLLSLAGISQSDFAKPNAQSKKILIEANYTEPAILSVAIGENKELKSGDHTFISTRGSEPDLSVGNEYLFAIFSKEKEIEIYGDLQQILPVDEPKIIKIDVDEICAMSGAQVDKNQIVKILKNLQFDIAPDHEFLSVKVPKFRHDIENSHDICEEIVRIIGIDNIPSTPLKFSEKNRFNDAYLNYKNRREIRQKAVGAGFFECVHYVFDDSEKCAKLGFKECNVKILNPINGELDTLRPSLINHLINSASQNFKNSRRAVKLFEIGAIFDENGAQNLSLGFIQSGLIFEPSLLHSPRPAQVNFMHFASLIADTIGEFKAQIPDIKFEFLSEFEQANIVIDGENVGFIGRLDLNIENEFDLPKTYICEIDFKKLKFNKKVAQNYSKFQLVSRDLSIIIPRKMPYERVCNVINELKIPDLKAHFITDVYSDESLKDKQSVTIKFNFQNMQKTLEETEISGFIEQILGALNAKLGVGLR